MSNEDPHREEIPLPIEEGFRKAIRSGGWSFSWLGSKVHRFWRSHFSDNPLIRREAGFVEGKPWWKAPMVWAVGILLLERAVFEAYRIPLNLARHRFGRNVEAFMNWFQTHGLYLNAVSYAIWILGVLKPLIFVMIVTRAWGRDHSPAQRDQIGASPLTVAQLVGARTLLWMAPLLAFTVIAHLLNMTQLVIQGSSPFAVFMIPQHSAVYSIAMWAFGILVSDFIINLAILGIATRMILWGYRPALTTVIAGGILAVWSLWSFAIRFLNLMPSLRFYVIISYTQIGLTIALAIFAWWGLHRHVARRYGLER